MRNAPPTRLARHGAASSLLVLGVVAAIAGCGAPDVATAPSGEGAPDPRAGRPGGGGGIVVTDLGIPSGTNQSDAFGVNDRGQVVFRATGGSAGDQAMFWQNGTTTNLTPAGSQAFPFAVNNAASPQVVGQVRSGTGPSHAALWTVDPASPATATLLVLDQRPSSSSGINDQGVAVGFVCPTVCAFPGILPAAKWTVSSGAVSGVETADPLPGLTQAYAEDVNDLGVVVGVSQSPTDGTEAYRAFAWLPGGAVTELPPLAGHAWASAFAISNGDPAYVVGWSSSGGSDRQAVRWTITVAGSVGPAQLLSGLGNNSWGSGVNSAGQVAGCYSKATGAQRGYIWTNGAVQELPSPKGTRGNCARAMSRGPTRPMYVAGVASGTMPHAAVWTIP